MIDEARVILNIAFGVGVGFFIGLQREHAHTERGGDGGVFAGERTFSLLALAGALAALISEQLQAPMVFLIAIVFVALLSVSAYTVEAIRHGRRGITTEVAVLITVLIGGLSYWGYFILAGALGVIVTFILTIKLETDRFAQALTREDIFAVLQFAIITAVVLPVLPNRAFWDAPFDVLNPFNIWLMVVFISAINFLGYVLIKTLGTDSGLSLTGIVGGLVSSTAVTLGFSHLSKEDSKLGRPLAVAIVASWVMMFPRVLVLVGVINVELVADLWLPLSLTALAALGHALFLFFSQSKGKGKSVDFSNPFDLMSALRFGLLYALVLLIARTAQIYFGDSGVLLASAVSGLAGMDAITLSMSELSRSGGLSLNIAAQALVFAVISNTVTKGGIVFALGSPELRKAVWPGVMLIFIAGMGAVFLL